MEDSSKSQEVALHGNSLPTKIPTTIQTIADEVAATEKLHLVARDPQQMAAAQADLALWLNHKVASYESEVSELANALAVAKQNKWATSTLASQHRKAIVRHRFYQKTLLAVQQGYTIIPNFPIDVFAIRVRKESPKYQFLERKNWPPNMEDEKPQILDAGEGRYQSPSQSVNQGETTEQQTDGSEVTKHWMETAGFADVEFPIIAARPEVMSAAAHAMAAKVFDQIGICPQSRRGDPLIIGQIREKNGWSSKTVSFLLCWHLDLRTL